MRQKVHAVVQDAAYFDEILGGEAVNEKVPRAANATYCLGDPIATEKEMIGSGILRNLFTCGAASTLRVLADIDIACTSSASYCSRACSPKRS